MNSNIPYQNQRKPVRSVLMIYSFALAIVIGLAPPVPKQPLPPPAIRIEASVRLKAVAQLETVAVAFRLTVANKVLHTRSAAIRKARPKPAAQPQTSQTAVVTRATADNKQANFVATVVSYADQASKDTGIDARLIIAQWALESGWNAAGASIAPYNLAGIMAGRGLQRFSSLEAFARQYATDLMGASYASVRHASGVWAQELALKASPWSTDHYAGGTLNRILSLILQMVP